MAQFRKDFIAAFAKTIGVSEIEAEVQWAGFSKQLSDAGREEIEDRGEAAGEREGLAFLKLYPRE